MVRLVTRPMSVSATVDSVVMPAPLVDGVTESDTGSDSDSVSGSASPSPTAIDVDDDSVRDSVHKLNFLEAKYVSNTLTAFWLAFFVFSESFPSKMDEISASDNSGNLHATADMLLTSAKRLARFQGVGEFQNATRDLIG